MRLAEPRDYLAVVDMAEEFAKSYPSNLSVSREKIEAVITSMLDSGVDRSIVLVSTADDVPVGLLLATVTEPIFSTDRVATEVMWYMRPGYKGGLKLHQAFEYWARRVGAKIAATSTVDDRPKRYLLRKGYRPTEYAFFKELQ